MLIMNESSTESSGWIRAFEQNFKSQGGKSDFIQSNPEAKNRGLSILLEDQELFQPQDTI